MVLGQVLLQVIPKMNKILLENKYLENDNLKLLINNNINLEHYCKSLKNVDIKLEDNSRLLFHSFYELKNDAKINFILVNNSFLDYTIVIVNKGINTLEIDAKSVGNNNNFKIKLRVINKDKNSKVNIIVNGIICENTIDNELLEDLKGLVLYEDEIKISPNMLVNTNEVLANHLVTVGSFRSEELFYLKSKGLSEYTAKRMLLEAFITNCLTDNLKEKMNLEVIKFE